MSMPAFRSLVPHAGPMALLDRVLEADEESLCAEVAIRADSLFYAEGGVGSWVGIEYMAQAVAAHAGYLARQRGEAVKPGFLLGSRRYHHQSLVRAGRRAARAGAAGAARRERAGGF
ncbi:hypothetical protein [Massilia sp. MB5]|uniref:ApeP family dehydratase n=1 Tax=Massilia sp. MB5 TaxID=2919578 RepID=UPI0027D939D3|nr:hypothetical protein [Massilia sp. MB5]